MDRSLAIQGKDREWFVTASLSCLLNQLQTNFGLSVLTPMGTKVPEFQLNRISNG
jgi:hypothetical protein